MICDECETVAHCMKNGCVPKTNVQQDIPDLIAGALGVSRGTAYDMMREALADAQPQQEQDADHEFKNFHRTMCERFGYTHDERDWKRDQVSLIEWIAKKVEQPAQQEPVAKKKKHEPTIDLGKYAGTYGGYVTEKEPVAYGMWDTMLGFCKRMMMVRLDKGQDGCTIPLYTSPPAQRKPLTEEEQEVVWQRIDREATSWRYNTYKDRVK